MKVILFILCALSVSVAAQAQKSSAILIAAASDLKFALDSAISVFRNIHPDLRVDVTYGSSGKLYEQISHSAPFDLFFSADIEYPLNLKKNGMASSEVYSYGIGRLVLWSKVMDPNTQRMKTLLMSSIQKIAIANPRHAPYGKRAEEALRNSEIYDKVKQKLVYGENISHAAQFASTGAADAGIIALSLALSPAMKKHDGKYFLIPDSLHKPLEQGFVLLKQGGGNVHAIAFKDFMMTPTAIRILGVYGFVKK